MYNALRFYPYWAIPVALILAEVGRHFFRTGKKPVAKATWVVAGILAGGTAVWLIFPTV